MKINFKKGYTLVEFLVTMGIFLLIALGVTYFGRNVFVFSKFASDSLSAIQDGRSILRTMVRELRSTSPSNTGSYPLLAVSTSSITFYDDTNSDGLKEQIRYFLQGTTLNRGSIKPTINPVVYSPASEIITQLAVNVKNSSSTPLFEYFDTNYAGTTSPLVLPTNITNVRLVKINLLLDVDPNRSPIPRTYTSQVSLRNLKDNL